MNLRLLFDPEDGTYTLTQQRPQDKKDRFFGYWSTAPISPININDDITDTSYQLHWWEYTHLQVVDTFPTVQDYIHWYNNHPELLI